MLINLRNALMTGKRLPYDAEVEYLESTGTQWIDTGFKANTATTRLEASIEFTDPTSAQGVFGSRNRSTGNLASCNAFVLATNIFRPDWAAGSDGSSYNITISPNTIYEIFITRGRLTLNGTVHTYQTSGSVDQEYNFLLFNFSDAGSVFSSGLKGRLRYAKIYSNDTLVRDFIPVRVGTVGYLYDRVSGKLFGNAGTGDFVLGPDVVPVEYIESHGTEYIDTGITPTADDSFYCRVKQSIVRDQCLWGLAGVAYCFSNSDGGAANGTYWGHPAIGQGGVHNVNPLGDTGWHEILCQPSGIFVDGVQINTQVSASAQSPLNTVALFARAVNSAGGGVAKKGQGRMSAFRVERNGDPLRSFRPVRVGTDATSWEGAMMDTLTRRIYRNAGTGAFTYGNDLPYPIPAS